MHANKLKQVKNVAKKYIKWRLVPLFSIKEFHKVELSSTFEMNVIKSSLTVSDYNSFIWVSGTFFALSELANCRLKYNSGLSKFNTRTQITHLREISQKSKCAVGQFFLLQIINKQDNFCLSPIR